MSRRCCVAWKMSNPADEIIGILSSLSKVSSKDLFPSSLTDDPGSGGSHGPIVFGSEGALIRKVLNSYDLYKETLLPRVFMVSGDYQIGWVLNDAVAACMVCEEPFTLLIPRHHCRSCGCLVCHECSPQRVPILQLSSNKRYRVCDLCAVKHLDHEVWDLNDKNDDCGIAEDGKENETGEVMEEKNRETDHAANLFSDV